MTSKQMARQVRLSQWAGIIRERIESGKSIRKWCEEHGVQEKTYYYWQRKLREAACEMIEQRKAPDMLSKGKPLLPPSGWSLCESTGAGNALETITIEIGGCHILIRSGFEPELLKNVCRVLKAL
jgi:putative transposase